MRRIVALTGAFLLALVPVGVGAPVDGPASLNKKRVEQRSLGVNGEILPGELEFEKTFRAGERACVMVIGDHDPVVDLSIIVTDKAGNVVAEDRGSGKAGDFVAAIWYPAREEAFVIRILNPGTEFNAVNIAIK